MESTEYCSMQNGSLDSYKTSILLTEIIKTAQKDFLLLKGGIANGDSKAWGTSPLFIERTAKELSFHGFLSALKQIKTEAAENQYDLALYYQMVKAWSSEICLLRSASIKLRKLSA